MGLSFTIAAGPRQRILRSDSRGTHDHILPGWPGPRIYIPQEEGDSVIPQGTRFHFVVSYDSQGYGGSIRPRLHTGAHDQFLLNNM
jgi:hypothetical protein